MIPIYIAFLWHMHQPVYWPGESVMETEAAGRYGFSVLTVHLDRTGPYTAWPINAVQAAMEAGLGNCGAQVSFTGSLMENLVAIETAGAGFSNWNSRWNEAGEWLTDLGNPRIDMVSMGYYHPIFPLVGWEEIGIQVEMHRIALRDYFPDASGSKGMFPPETGFSPEIIPPLVRAGVEWVIVDNIHFDRTLPDYPWRREGNLFPPNGADVRSSAEVSWVSLSGIWAPTPVSAPWSYRPHRARYMDPESGEVSEIIVVPGARYEGNEDARGGFGALSYETVLSQLEPFNTDPEHPMLVVLHHDGDNYGGGTESYYHSNFDRFVDWVGSSGGRFACTTIQDYLDRFPPGPGDVIWVEPGSWSGASNGDPEFEKWNGEPDETGYSPDRSSWAVVTAAQNRVYHANFLQPYVSIEAVRVGSGSETERALHWLMVAETSCYWYWDGAEGGVWDSHPARAANRAFEGADSVIAAHPGEDPVGPAIYPPQREPYNPGGFEWSAEREPSDFEVWTLIYDVSGVESAFLRWRIDDDGILTDANDILSTGGWCDIPMEETPILPETDPMPLYHASLYRAVVRGVQDAMVDYFVLAEDGRGNSAMSLIKHVYVGASTESGGEDLVYYPLSPTMFDEMTLLAGREADLHWGVNGWITPPDVYWPPGSVDFGDGRAVETPMADVDGDTLFEAVVGPFSDPAHVVREFDFVFHYADGSWSSPDIAVAINNSPGPEPHAFIVSPRDGEIVSGIREIHATASAEAGIEMVEIFACGSPVASLFDPPYLEEWDTTFFDDGPCAVRVEARDPAGRIGEAHVEVEVKNSSSGECVIFTDGGVEEEVAEEAHMETAETGAEAPDAADGVTDASVEAGDLFPDLMEDTSGGGNGGGGCSCGIVN